MKIVFVSNYFNHHQQELSESLYRGTDGEFRFIATSVMRQERKKLGYETDKTSEFVLHTYLNETERRDAERWIMDADVVIAGSMPKDLLEPRKKAGKLIFRYSERLLKQGLQLYKYPYRWVKLHRQNPKTVSQYMLCASAYTSVDYLKFGCFKDKCFKWGYFPETKRYDDIFEIIQLKKKNTLLWAGRFLDWKHPDDAIRLASNLKKSGYQFELNIIGTGKMELRLKEMIAELGLTDCVHLLGPMKPEQVRTYMEQSQIFLFTSDRQEGWGAVLNESMNSGCAVVASHAIGAVPFLLNNKENGLVYKSGDLDMLCEKVKYLLDHPEEQKRFGMKAYRTIVEEWNAEVAAKRLINLAKHILAGEKSLDIYETGPCSKAKIVRDNWLR